VNSSMSDLSSPESNGAGDGPEPMAWVRLCRMAVLVPGGGRLLMFRWYVCLACASVPR
jgi:hypothetical protein